MHSDILPGHMIYKLLFTKQYFSNRQIFIFKLTIKKIKTKENTTE